MNDLRAAAQQALEALLTPSGAQACSTCQNGPENEYCCRMEMWSAIAALRAALAQQDEPLNLADPAVQRRLAAQWGYVPAALAEPVQEPVAWNWMLDGLPYGRACYGDPPDADLAERAATAGRTVRLLYTAPPQRKLVPLTEEEIIDAVRDADLDWTRGWTLDETHGNRFAALARAVEKASWEKNHG